MRLIDADALKKHVISFTGMFTDELGFAVSMDAVLGAIDFAPTIKAEPARYGHWKSSPFGLYACSECGAIDRFGLSSYCPNCSAKMYGGTSDGSIGE